MEVIFEDNHIIAINKQVSDIVQGDKTGDIPLTEKVKEYLKIYAKGRFFVCNLTSDTCVIGWHSCLHTYAIQNRTYYL